MREVIDLAPASSHGLATEPLLADAGAAVAARLGADAATLTHGLAGAVLLAALALRPAGRPIVYLAAHDIAIAGPLRDLLAMAGGAAQAVGSVDRATRAELEAALTSETAAAIYVAEDRLAVADLIGLAAFRHTARQCGIPTVVIAPGSPDIEALLDAGADLVILDAATALAGPPLGIVAGRQDLVERAAMAQFAGPGGLTRPAPDHLAALVATAPPGRAALLQARRGRLGERLAAYPGLRLEPAAAGAILHLDPETAPATAGDLAQALATGHPVLLVDDRDRHQGRLGLDLARLDDAAFETVIDTLTRTLDQPIPPAPWP